MWKCDCGKWNESNQQNCYYCQPLNKMNTKLSKTNWVCESCKTKDFTATNGYTQTACWACSKKRDEDIIIIPPDDEPVDVKWICKVCSSENLLGQITCIQCKSQRTEQEPMENTDWECVLCHSWNFERTEVCLHCGCSSKATIPNKTDTFPYPKLDLTTLTWKCNHCDTTNDDEIYYCIKCKYWRYHTTNDRNWPHYAAPYTTGSAYVPKKKIKFFKVIKLKKETSEKEKPKISKVIKKKK